MFHNFQSERTPVVVLWLHQRPNTSRRSQGRGAKRCVGPLGQSAKLGINRGKTYYPLVIKNSYGKWPIEIDGLPNLKMVIFHSYVSLPEGNKLSSPQMPKSFRRSSIDQFTHATFWSAFTKFHVNLGFSMSLTVWRPLNMTDGDDMHIPGRSGPGRVFLVEHISPGLIEVEKSGVFCTSSWQKAYWII